MWDGWRIHLALTGKDQRADNSDRYHNGCLLQVTNSKKKDIEKNLFRNWRKLHKTSGLCITTDFSYPNICEKGNVARSINTDGSELTGPAVFYPIGPRAPVKLNFWPSVPAWDRAVGIPLPVLSPSLCLGQALKPCFRGFPGRALSLSLASSWTCWMGPGPDSPLAWGCQGSHWHHHPAQLSLLVAVWNHHPKGGPCLAWSHIQLAYPLQKAALLTRCTNGCWILSFLNKADVAKKERERLEFNILKELEQLAYKEKAVKAGFIQFGEHFWGRSYCYSPLVKVLRR